LGPVEITPVVSFKKNADERWLKRELEAAGLD
jgi:hypothetical protein